MSKQIIILGMHRSGTSTLAMRLKKSGLHMGDQLLGSGLGNPLGHFEDKEILGLHNDILSFNHLDFRVTKKVIWNYDQEHRAERDRIISVRNSSHDSWGWKDPRTCLFIDFWEEVLHNPLYLIAIRDPESVVQSLLSRDWNQALRFKTLRLPRRWKARLELRRRRQVDANLYLETYIHYNECILKDVINRKSNFIVTPFDQVVRSVELPYQAMRDFGVDLKNISGAPGVAALKRKTFDIDLNLKSLLKAQTVFDQISSYAN